MSMPVNAQTSKILPGIARNSLYKQLNVWVRVVIFLSGANWITAQRVIIVHKESISLRRAQLPGKSNNRLNTSDLMIRYLINKK